ncbi:DUF3105 domain-containing protein [Sporichthya polymorpha]|uniref:DUF3105 domain-containing protein n=1 Tax=Sporichthya polymorpha TaxID=35751 RepID=UPI0012EC7D1D|nr:DUF3105 domain-containing protein [Sporichthya polymorpha]
MLAAGVLTASAVGALAFQGLDAGSDAGGPPSELFGTVTTTPTARHVDGKVRYTETPPAGGDHAPAWLNCATYTRPVPDENAVHSLEHGAVWITYHPKLAVPDLKRLLDLAPLDYTILSPYPGLPSPIVVSAWGRQLAISNPADPRLLEFIRRFRLGPQAPEAGAPCAGGVGG